MCRLGVLCPLVTLYSLFIRLTSMQFRSHRRGLLTHLVIINSIISLSALRPGARSLSPRVGMRQTSARIPKSFPWRGDGMIRNNRREVGFPTMPSTGAGAGGVNSVGRAVGEGGRERF